MVRLFNEMEIDLTTNTESSIKRFYYFKNLYRDRDKHRNWYCGFGLIQGSQSQNSLKYVIITPWISFDRRLD
jgi:hypothetical protein